MSLSGVEIAACLTKPIAASDLHAAICAVLDAGASRPAKPAETVRQAPTAAVRPRKVLLAEDNIVNQRVAVGLLGRRGHHVTVVANGQQAVDAVGREQFDIVLMDLQMPVMGGLEATRIIRERERETSSARLRIVAMTAHAMRGDRERCIEAGMDGYLSKPTEASTLYAEVEGPADTAPAPLFDEKDCASLDRWRRSDCRLHRLPEASQAGSPVVRLVAPLPLDVAADTRLLVDRHGLASKHRCGRRSRVRSGDRHLTPRPAVVELPAVDEPSTTVEQEQVWCAGGLERFRDLLRFVEEIGNV